MSSNVAVQLSAGVQNREDLEPRLRILSMTHIPSASALSIFHDNQSKKHFSLPAITVSSSTTSNLLLIETINSCRSLFPLSLLESSDHSDNSNDEIGENALYVDAIVAKRSPSITTCAADHSPLRVLEIGPSFEETVESSECPGAGDVKGRETSLKDALDKFGKNLTLRISGGYFSKRSDKLIDELEELAHVIKRLDIPVRLSSVEGPPIHFASDPAFKKFLIMEKEEISGSVFGLGIRLPGETHGEENPVSLRTARPPQESISSTRHRFHNDFGSLQKSAELLSPRQPVGPPPSPANWRPASSTSDRPTFTRPRQNSLPLEHILVKEKSKSMPTSPTGSIFAGSTEFIRRSFDIITPRPRLPSVRPSPKNHDILSPPVTFNVAKFSSLRDIVKGR